MSIAGIGTRACREGTTFAGYFVDLFRAIFLDTSKKPVPFLIVI
ncbi:13330_t:CDS:2 [Gigaspora rosea]|nr:13330_t:CDS:2 [Gigaspora rosea]